MAKGTEKQIENTNVPEIKDNSFKTKKKIDHDIEVTFSNFTSNGFFYIDPKTTNRYDLQEYGDKNYITIGELFSMKNKERDNLEKFYIILEEVMSDEVSLDDVLGYLNIKDRYDKVRDYFDVEKVLNEKSIEELANMFNTLPNDFMVALVSISHLLYRQGKFNDYKKMEWIRKYTKSEGLYN